jgi:NAD(P)-dependent dehydrogenase (short-subunit alcohol dehydrogenase family)
MRLTNKCVVVTGATGIAAAAARRLVEEGARVFVTSIEASDCEALAGSVGLAGWSAADLSLEKEAVHAIRAAVGALGSIDGLLAVAGGSGRESGDGPVHNIPYAGWDATISKNLTTTFLSARETLKSMLETDSGGSIVLMSSVLASHPSPGLFNTHAYAAAKGAQLSLMKAMAAYYAPKRIRVNAIAPGLVRTPMSERAYNDPATFQYSSGKQPLVSGFLEPDDVVGAAIFLLGDESRGVTGQVLGVDGGWAVTEGRQ